MNNAGTSSMKAGTGETKLSNFKISEPQSGLFLVHKPFDDLVGKDLKKREI
jgi:hypothetical protein